MTQPPVQPTAHQNRRGSIVDALPKAELHLHLEGTIRPDTAIELAARHDVALSRDEILRRYRYADFLGFIETFKWVTSFLRQPDDYRVITHAMCQELLRQNVVYAEVTISAGVMLRRMQNVEANFAAIRETAESVPFSRLRINWIFDAARQFGADAAKEVARWAAKLHKWGVVAFGMGGDELAFPTASFRPAFDLARSEGLQIVCHAGEIGGPESVREAVEMLGAERIGHGIAVIQDPALADALIQRRIVLENCPTSNICTGALAKLAGKPDVSMAYHPLPKFLQRGLRVTLSTDDPGLFHTDLLSEYCHAAALNIPRDHLLRLTQEGFSAAFLPPIEKRKLLDDFRAAAKSAGLL